jgi:hypothetical protein
MYQQKRVGQARMMKIGENKVGRKSSTTRSTFGRSTKRRGKLEVVSGCMCLKRCCQVSSGAPRTRCATNNMAPTTTHPPTLISGASKGRAPHIFDILVAHFHEVRHL